MGGQAYGDSEGVKVRRRQWLENVRAFFRGGKHDGRDGISGARLQFGRLAKFEASVSHRFDRFSHCICDQCVAFSRAELRRILRTSNTGPTNKATNSQPIGEKNMATINSSTVQTIAQVLLEAEQFLAGQPIVVEVPEEKLEIAGVKVAIAATSVTFTK